MNTLDQPSVTFRPAAFLSGAPGPWAGHLPFACDLIAALKPQVIVELGVYYGDSYFGFCQSVAESNLACTCYGVDTWRGDARSGLYENSVFDAVSRHNDRHYRAFSYLLRTTFDDAIHQFSDQSISLLHLDGSHTYEAALHDFNNWLPKVRPGGVILLHDIAVRSGDYGVWRLWEELQKKFPNFAFRNNSGLGVLWKPGGTDEKNAYLRELFSSSRENQERVRRYYCLCAEHLELEHKLGVSRTDDAGLSLLQVVSSREGQYRRDDRLTQLVEPGKWFNAFLRLPRGLGDRPLRIDPANRTGIVDIASILLRKVGGRTVWSWHPQESADIFRVEGTAFRLPSSESLRIISFGNNPQVFLPEIQGISTDEPLELEIRMRVDLELNAVQDVAQKAADLQKERAEWEQTRQQEIARLERARAQPAAAPALSAEREQELLRKHEASKLVLMQQNEETKRALVIQHEQILQSLAAQHDEEKEVLVEQFEHARQELEARLAQAEEQLEQHRKAQLAGIADRERIQASHRLLNQELSIARGNVDELKAEIERLTTIQAQSQADLVDARKLNSRLTNTLDQERLLRAMIENSRSWQLTRPFRNMLGLFSAKPRP